MVILAVNRNKRGGFSLKKVISIILAVFLVAILVVGCGKSDTKATDAAKGAEGGAKKKIAVIVKGTEHVYWQSVKVGAEAAAKAGGIDMYFTGASGGESDINGEVNLVENAINQKVAGIVLAASDAKALVPVTEKAIAAGIPVVIIDSGLNTDKYKSFLTTDNIAASAAVGESLAKMLDGKGKVAIVNFIPGAQTAIEREKGFRDVMAKYPGITVLPTQFYNSDKQKALSLTQDLMTANPDLAAVYACNEAGTVGAGRALKEKNNKTIIEVGFDASDDVIPLIKDGYCKAAVVQMPYNMGFKGVQAIVDILAGKTVEKNVDTGFTIVTPENMTSPESEKALYPTGKK
jgi:ribose transport system substrate-binding protein